MGITRLSKANMASRILTLSTSSTKVTAASHRSLEAATLDYAAYQILCTGYFNFEDVYNSTKNVPLNLTLSNTDYEIFGTMISTSGDWNKDNDAVFCIGTKFTNSFNLVMGEYNGVYQYIGFQWMAVHRGISNITIL